MAYVYLFIAVAAFYAAIHRFTELQTKQKLLGSAVFFALVLAIVWFETHNDNQRDKVHQLVFAFEHNKTLVCQEDVLVNKENFNYSIGGHSFLGRANTSVKGLIIPISTCKIKD